MISWVADLECGVWSRFKKSLGGRRLELELGRTETTVRFVSMRYFGEHGHYRIWMDCVEEPPDLRDRAVTSIQRIPRTGEWIPLGEKYLTYPDGIVPPRTLGETVKFLDLLDGVDPKGVYSAD